MEKNADRFITAFNDIDKYLRTKLKEDNNTSFYTLVNKAAERYSVIRRFEKDLKDFGDLRNAIVHSYNRDKLIAIPIDETVRNIEDIERAIMNPEKVGQKFKRNVTTVNVNSYLSDILPAMKDYLLLTEDCRLFDCSSFCRFRFHVTS